MTRFLLLSVIFLIQLTAAEELWFVGTLGGQPLVTMHLESHTSPDGGCQTVCEMLMVIRRSMPGQPEFRMEMRETQTIQERADGVISSFRFDHDENGSVTTASGTVSQTAVTGVLSRLGRTTPFVLPVAAGVRLLGDRASQIALAKSGLTPGASLTFHSLGLISNQVTIMTSQATSRGMKGGFLQFDVIPDIMPVPMQLRLSPEGILAGMTMNLGLMVLDLQPSAGPIALLGAELPPTGLVKAAGPAPAMAAQNRLQIPPGAPLPKDPFQSEAANVVTVVAQAAPSPMDAQQKEGYLASSAQLELDDATLRAWALTNAGDGTTDERAERLRLAVRSHITTKDLAKGDGSALETFRSKRGDCTEHATLLTAALRIAGIPARVQVGLVYAADYGGWVGHAWNQAYVDGCWTHLDSAYPGIVRSRYLGLGYADGLQAGGALMVQLNRFLGQTVTVIP